MKQIIKSFLVISVLFCSSIFGQSNLTHKSLISGYTFTNFEKADHEDGQFEVGFNPIFLWSINNNILFESELEFELEDGNTNVALEYAQMLYTANDYLTIGVGKFLNPSNIFAERYHPAWINKLPTMPLGFSGHGGIQLISGTQIGAQLRGAIPIGPAKIVYSAYVSNGPVLNIGEEDSAHAVVILKSNVTTGIKDGGGEESAHEIGAQGTLSYNNIPDNNGNKAIGGRIGVFPTPNFELGFSFETSNVGESNSEFENVNSILNSADLSYYKDVRFLAGRLDVKAQMIWLNIDNPNVDHLNFKNESSAYYAQLSYLPYNVKNEFINDLEFVVRYENLDLPEGSEFGIDKTRITAGLNYWLNESSVVKLAYESTTASHEEGDETENGIALQMSMGF